MHKSAMACLMFTCDDEQTAEILTSLLGERGICLTCVTEPDRCFDLLGTRDWGFLVIDANGDKRDPLHLLSQARRFWPDVPVLVLVEEGDAATAVQAMKAGAADCIETPVRTAPLLSAVTSLCRQGVRRGRSLRVNLTRAERIVLWHLLDGRTNQQIADMLCRSTRTIEVHRRSIMKKLGVANLVELVKQTMCADEVGCIMGSR